MIKKLTFLSVFGSAFLYGQSLSEIIDLSLENKQIQSQKAKLASLNFEYDSYKKSNLPSISIGARYAITNEETAGVPESGTSAYAKASYTLYDGSKRGNIYELYENSIKSVDYSLEDTKNNIALLVIESYYNYQSFKSAKEAKQKEIETLRAQQVRLENFYKVGGVTSDQVDKIKSSLASANVALHEIELQLQTILHNLYYITGRDITIDTKEQLPAIEGIEKEKRADIKALEYSVKSSLSNAKSTKSGYLPTINLDNTYSVYEYDYKNDAYSSSVPDSQNIASINLSWDIFSFGSTSKQYESAYKTYLSQKDILEYEQNKANVDLQLAKKSYTIAKLKIEAAKSNVFAANSAYDVIESQYQNGATDNVTYLDALSSKYNAQSMYEKAKNDLEIQKAKIVFHSGKNLQEYIK